MTRTVSVHDPARDRGAALIIAIGFVVMIGAISAGLTAMVTSGIGNRVALEQIRDRQYAADGAVEDAVAELRFLLDVGKFTCGDASAGAVRLNDVDIRIEVTVTCNAVLGDDGFPVVQMSGEFVACEDRRAACEPTDIVIRALVAYATDADGRVIDTAVRSWSVLR
jgi:hypothetical protein